MKVCPGPVQESAEHFLPNLALALSFLNPHSPCSNSIQTRPGYRPCSNCANLNRRRSELGERQAAAVKGDISVGPCGGKVIGQYSLPVWVALGSQHLPEAQQRPAVPRQLHQILPVCLCTKFTAHERAKCGNISCTPATTKMHYPELRWCCRSCHSSPCACDITLHKSRANGNAADVTFSAILQSAQMHILGTRQTSLPARLQFASLVKQAGPEQRTRSGLMTVLR